MQKLFIALFGALSLFASLSAQTTSPAKASSPAEATKAGLFMHRNLQKTYERGTRSADGKPGPNYWQNRASYLLQASLEPRSRRLSGEETVTYFNNSPDTLKQIRFKLQHDRYRKGAARAYDVTPSDIEDEGTRIESISYNGNSVDEKKRNRFATFLDLNIGEAPLPPRSSATFTVKWSYTLPAGQDAAREFAADSTVFFVPYWYPQIAVYDDINGWASVPYTGMQEFYHDFADYDVTLTLPAGFQAWATGEWQNAADVLEKTYFERWQKAHTGEDVVAVFSEKELKAGGVYRKNGPNAFHFKATDVPDFAFAASNRYNWDATSTVVDDKTGRRVFVGAVYDTKSLDYPQVARIGADAIRLMSTWLPGYPYPWPCMTVFNGNDGMEYPMMCNDASQGSNSPMTLTVHEISHTYFPFMMGINEQDYAWMDEGWAAFFDYTLSDSLSHHTLGRSRGYGNVAGTDNDAPPMVRSRELSNSYRNASYARPQAAYFTLLDLLGYEKFHTCMRAYMDRWKGKHPMPYDFFNTWSQVSGENLDWFWKPWFFEWAYPDLAVESVVFNKKTRRADVVIAKKGAQPIPIHLEVEYSDGTKGTFHQTAAVWKKGATQFTLPLATGKTVKSLKLGSVTIPDADAKNNEWARP